MDYELYLDGQPSGNIVSGTGDSISFGLINTVGFYTALGFTEYCEEYMVGQVYVNQWAIPGQAQTPVGIEETCDNESNVYTTEEIAEADWYVWTLDPTQAGLLAPADDSVTITWNYGFSGNAMLSVHAENICGIGLESDPLEINVSLSPDPVISGAQLVNQGSEEQYQTVDNPGNTYYWEVEGGTITAGGATHQVTVMWGDPGEGSLTVTEGSTTGCSSITNPYLVIIDEAITIEENYLRNMLIYPNPAYSITTIETSIILQKNTTLSISNTSGQQLIIQQIRNSKTDIDISSLPSGIYIVKVWNDKSVMVQKVIKQ